MITKPKPAHALVPGFLLAACVGLPGLSAAQSATPAKGPDTLGAAMAEARRSPFHATNGSEGLAIVNPAGAPTTHAGDRPVPDSARGPSFHRVFWPTLGAVFLSEVAFAGLILYCDPDGGGSGDGCTEAQWKRRLVVGGAITVLLPSAAARVTGGSFAKGVLGSALGAGLGVAAFHLGLEIGLDDSIAYWALPTSHAIVTTAFSRLRARTP